MSKKCNCGHELIFFHDEKKGEIILSFNGDRHVYDDGIAKAVEAERDRIIKLLEEAKPLQETDELEWGIDSAIALIKGEAE